MGSLRKLLHFNAIEDAYLKPKKVYFYNNLVQSSNCVPVVKCGELDGVIASADVAFRNIHHSNPACGDWIGFQNCNESSIVLNDGNNTFGKIDFVGGTEEDKPYPFYDLNTDIIGLTFPSSFHALSLPNEDFEGRPRPGPDILNRTSVGAFEFQCPESCGMIDCQTKNCSCLKGWVGNSCETRVYCPKCHEGNCTFNSTSGYYYCVCEPKYSGELCNATTCEGVSNSEDEVCSGHGSCSYFDECVCEDDYYGFNCNITKCFSIFNNETTGDTVCSNHGECNSYDHCDCDSKYYGYNCSLFECFGVIANLTKSCGDYGYCDGLDKCKCDQNYYGLNCNTTTCYDIFSNDTDNMDCGNFGDCIDHDRCKCDDFYYGDFCNITKCNDTFSNETEVVCSSHGECINYEDCRCFNDSIYSGIYCQNWDCFDLMNSNLEEVCSGHGNCVDYNNCTCVQNYTHLTTKNENDCGSYECFGFLFNDLNSVCSGYGNCTSHDQCDCEEGYNSTSDCSDWPCFEISTKNTEEVCTGFGHCTSIDHCECKTSEYTGEKCDIYTCFNISSHNTLEVCGGHGFCIDIDECLCLSNYYSSSQRSPCDIWNCYGVSKDAEDIVCSRKGTCRSPDSCSCEDDFEGDNCDTWSCGFDHKFPQTCSGNGQCLGPNDCKCATGFDGELCENNLLYASVMAPVLTVAGIGFFIGLLVLGFICICCCFLACAVVSLILCLLCAIMGLLSCFLYIQRKGLKKFGKLKNFDILMHEQELEEDTSVAHIKINKNLFEVGLKEIRIQRILGEGGSSSVVYLAKWKNRDIAFKCFKTRQVCSSQNDFDEFEREVQVLSSVSHPNIIQFYGACLAPPRVGILMEFCVGGDLEVFLKRYCVDHNDSKYPFSEKLRMVFEICSSLEYIHSRNIIHRDLKLENVLVDKSEHCKLMDFGLSKIVDRMSKAKTKKVGTSIYMSPEIVKTGMYDQKCDVFSFSILFFIMMTEEYFPYGREVISSVEMRVANDATYRPDISLIDKKEENEIPKSYRGFVKDIIIRCWDHDKDKRYSFTEIIELLDKVFESGVENAFSLVNNKKNKDTRITLGNPGFEEEDEKEDLKDLKIQELEKKNQKLMEAVQKVLEKNNLSMALLDEYLLEEEKSEESEEDDNDNESEESESGTGSEDEEND